MKKIPLKDINQQILKYLPLPTDCLGLDLDLELPYALLCEFYEISYANEGSQEYEVLEHNKKNLEFLYHQIFGGREVAKGDVIMYSTYDENLKSLIGLKFPAERLKQVLMEDYYNMYGRYRLFWGYDETTYFFFPEAEELFIYSHPGYITHIRLRNVTPKQGKAYPLMVNGHLYSGFSELQKGKYAIHFSYTKSKIKEINEILGELISIWNIHEFGKAMWTADEVTISILNISEQDVEKIRELPLRIDAVGLNL